MYPHRILFAALCVCFLSLSSVFAERAPLSPEKLQKESTHIFEGKVLGVYSRTADSNLYGVGTLVTRYVVEIEVDAVEKGQEIHPTHIVYVRAWKLKRRGATGLVPGPSGHFTIPEEGDQVRVHAAQGHYGPMGQDDRGMSAVYPNGFTVLKAEPVTEE